MSKHKRRHAQAWAPYNFVPMLDKPLYAALDRDAQRHDVYAQGTHTGYFDVALTTETPLFIRGMLTEDQVTVTDENGVKRPNTEQEIGELTRNNAAFFSIDGERPVIPGSSLRGMLRTLVEIITRSKMHFVSDNKLVYRAIYYADALTNTYRDIATDVTGAKKYVYPTRQMHGGYLRRGESPSGWVIQPAKQHYDESFTLVKRKDVVDQGISEKPAFKTYSVGVRPPTGRHTHTGNQGVELEIAEAGGIKRQPGADYVAATLLISSTVGKIGGKGSNRTWYPAIYAEDPDAEPIPISQRIWDDFVMDRDLKRGIDNRRIEREGDMLFYLLDNNGELRFFGPTMFFRMPYDYSIQQLVPAELRQHNPRLDYTEALFGYVSEQGEDRTVPTYAGRVSVTSAHVTHVPGEGGYYDAEIVPRILASPKPTTFQHYLEQPDAAKGLDGDVAKLHHYGTRGAKLRGRKLYWRQGIADATAAQEPDRNKTPENSTQHTRMTPVKRGVTFNFRVYFDGLTAIELGALTWVLTLGGSPNARHQLGMGKPFGLGVVKLTPQLVLTPREERYKHLFDEDGAWFTAATPATAEQQTGFISAFKQAVGNFDEQQHIHELLALVQMREPDENKFRYMEIEHEQDGKTVNEYQGRPVLPYPSDVVSGD